MTRLTQFIFTEVQRGAGKDPSDPVRSIAQLWTLDGKLVAEFDPTAPEPRPMQGDSCWWTGEPGAPL